MASVEGVERRTVLASAIGLAAVAYARRAWAQSDLVDLAVFNRETGQAFPVWRRDGRLFVAGEQGQRYSLRLTNNTGGRVLAVLSVDGVNVISGETAKYDQRGYVLRPYGWYDIVGWRKSTNEVADFAFTALPNSYAAETGRPGDVGVIGMAVFKERPPITPLAVTPERRSEADGPSAKSSVESVVVSGSKIARRDYAAPPPDGAPPPPLPLPPVEKPVAAPSNTAAQRSAPPTAAAPPPLPIPPVEKPFPGQLARDAKLGTAHGQIEASFINIVSFERATPYPQLVRQIEYDSYANLLRSGVIPRPRAFPGVPGFVPDPPRP
jgi:hypothetical protein